jgi:two-component system, OmpR family, heavy metal sensor histidine kinase CusS
MKLRSLVRIRSFRLRVALLSVVVSAVVLGVFGGLTFAAMQRISIQRMDEDIRESLHRHVVVPGSPGHWERVGNALSFFLGEEEENTFILLVKGRDGSLEYVSQNWPADLPTDDIPLPDAWGEYAHGEPPLGQRGRDYLHSRPRSTAEPSYDEARPFSSLLPPRESGPPPELRQGSAEAGSQDGGQESLFGPFAERPRPPIPLKTPEFSTREAGGAKWRVGMMGSPDLTVVLGLSMKRLNAEMAQVRRALLMVLPIALLFVALGAWWLSQRALEPIEAVTGTIKRVKAKGLDQRISGQDEDREFSEVIAVFNDMMDWIERGFHQAIRFSADASHELKTPLTVLQAQLEQAVNEAEPGSDEQRRYVALGKELQRLKSITQKLLLLSRIDAGELKLNLRPLNLSQLVEGIVEDTETLAPDLKVENELAPDLWVMGDEDLMKQVIQNLASNAVKFNREGGCVRFDLKASDEGVRLAIANSGPGIRPESRDEVFTRFYRGDKAHSRRVGGAGLGLSLAREIVRGHHGQLVLECSSSDATVFSLTLPKATRDSNAWAALAL